MVLSQDHFSALAKMDHFRASTRLANEHPPILQPARVTANIHQSWLDKNVNNMLAIANYPLLTGWKKDRRLPSGSESASRVKGAGGVKKEGQSR